MAWPNHTVARFSCTGASETYRSLHASHCNMRISCQGACRCQCTCHNQNACCHGGAWLTCHGNRSCAVPVLVHGALQTGLQNSPACAWRRCDLHLPAERSSETNPLAAPCKDRAFSLRVLMNNVFENTGQPSWKGSMLLAEVILDVPV